MCLRPKCSMPLLSAERLERVPTRWKHLCAVMPVPGLDPGIVAGIHVFLAAPQ